MDQEEADYADGPPAQHPWWMEPTDGQVMLILSIVGLIGFGFLAVLVWLALLF